MVKVSVIVPVYNVEGYIEKCLNSLVNQTLQEIEIIVVNDGSKDNSKRIIEKFINLYPQKIVYLEKENGGLSDARNYGIPHAKGEYIAFLDSDDYVNIDMYERMYQMAKRENSDMVQCNFYWEYPDKRKLGNLEVCNNKKEMLEKGRVEAWNKLIKREILEKAKIEFPKGYYYEDVEFTYKLIPFLDKVSFLEEPCVHYVQREGSIANVQNERTKEIFDVLDHVIQYYKENGYYEEYKEELEYVYVRYAFCRSLLRMVQVQDEKLQIELLELTWDKVNTTFPNWKKNTILKKRKNLKNLYIRTINHTTYKIYCAIFEVVNSIF